MNVIDPYLTVRYTPSIMTSLSLGHRHHHDHHVAHVSAEVYT